MSNPPPDIEIVTHCWNYSRLLLFQLWSVLTHPPASQITMTIAFCPDDERTSAVVEWFTGKAPHCSKTLTVNPIQLPPEKLCRRAIGRNIAAQATLARIVWFADCDYLFGPGCLDWLATHWPADAILAYPKIVRKCSKEYGDELIADVTAGRLVRPSLDKFGPRKHGRAIGGIQIVDGDVAREKGYVPNHKRYQKPVDCWKKTNEDTAYRRSLGTSGTRLEIPEVYRIRHTKYGRKDVGVEL